LKNINTMPKSTTNSTLQDARNLWLKSDRCLLSTHSIKYSGYPFGSVTPFRLDPSGHPLLLLSHLAQHTQNLSADPRCALTCVEPGSGDVQQLARLTCIGRIEQASSLPQEQAENYFAQFADSRDYFEQLNFRFYKLTPKRFYFIGGFGAARWYEAGQILS
jgi:putative heme iron utilization protein